MEARRLNEGAAFGLIRRPLTRLGPRSKRPSNDPRDTEKGRLRLARAVLDVANNPVTDAAQLARDALEAMALGYKRKP